MMGTADKNSPLEEHQDGDYTIPYPWGKSAIRPSQVIDLPSEALKEHASSGSMQLEIKNNKRSPLKECNTKVMLELTGDGYTINRPGLDLVAVLDVGRNMRGEKMDQLKIAMRFVLRKLCPIDRLSIVTFSSAATKLCPLQQISEASQRELQELIDGLKAFGSSTTNINKGLLAGLKVLADLKVSSGRVAGIILLCTWSMCNTGDATQVTVGNIPVYTFGFGADSNPGVLSPIAAKSMGGTFSHVQEQDIESGGLTMAFSQCLAGLLTVSVQDLELTVAPIGNESRIVKVTAGSYPQTHNGGSVTVSFGNLYSREVRNIIVDISLPAVDSEHTAEILKVTYSYSNSSAAGRLQFVAPPETLSLWRTGVEKMPLLAELQREEVRLQTAKMIEEARTMLSRTYYFAVQQHEVEMARKRLVQAKKMLEDVVEAVAQYDPLLRIELLELLELCKTRNICDVHGHA